MNDPETPSADSVLPPEAPPAKPPMPQPSPFSLFATLPNWFPPLFFLVLGLIFLGRSLLTGDVFLPATLLGHVAPWKYTPLFPTVPAWNPLRWDGIGQFYPWRHFAAETLRAGQIPLWNPYQFCGTPFVANSQSAVFYPGNLLFILIPDTAYAFGWSALLHLTLCGWFTYLLLRRLRCSELASLLGGVVYAYSAWQVAWLQLPTFLATSCWIPLLLYTIQGVGSRQWAVGTRVAGDRADQPDRTDQTDRPNPLHPTPYTLLPISGAVGMMLLAGHLQIALYGLLAGTLWAAARLLFGGREGRIQRLGVYFGGLVLGMMLAMPQLLPAIELSRISHRVGKPSAAGYAAYTEYGLPPSGLTMLFLPDFFGGDSDPGNPYWGYYRKNVGGGQLIAVIHNPAETAIYVGIAPLFLGMLACVRGLNRKAFDRKTALFAGLALLTLLLALGTPLDALLYFGVPGFGQSGSPARCLVVWALAMGGLAAFGLDSLLAKVPTKREVAIVSGVLFVVFALTLNLGAQSLKAPPPGVKSLPVIGEVFQRIGIGWAHFGLFALAGSGLLLWKRTQPSAFNFGMKGDSAFPLDSVQPSTPSPEIGAWRGALSLRSGEILSITALALVVIDLFWTGIGSNPTARREQVYPETPGIVYLREHAIHERIIPVNQRWSLFAPLPVSLPAVLPPNAATVYGLRDVQGYDSLFAGEYKAFANRFARPNRMGGLDASPLEVGNIVFFQNPNIPDVRETAAAFAVMVPYNTPGFAAEVAPPTTPLDTKDPGMTVYDLPHEPRASLSPAAPDSSVAWKEDTATCVTLDVSTTAQTTLILRDTLLPGWHASVDGHPVPIASMKDNPVYRAVSVPAGRHAVAFRYEPVSFRLGLYCACLASLLLFVGGTLCLTNRIAVNPKD